MTALNADEMGMQMGIKIKQNSNMERKETTIFYQKLLLLEIIIIRNYHYYNKWELSKLFMFTFVSIHWYLTTLHFQLFPKSNCFKW